MHRLIKFLSLTKREKELFFEASVLLLVSNACIKVVAFKRIDKFLRTHWNNEIDDAAHREQEIRPIRRSILRAASVLPWKNLCLCRSIAEFIMLRRRGIPALMFAGVRFSDQSSLEAHAWVDTGAGTIENRKENSDFTTLIKIGTEPFDQ